MSMSIMIDIDGVLADFVFGFTSLARVIDMSYERMPITHTWDHRSWGFDMPKSTQDKCWDMIKKNNDEWWGGLQNLLTEPEKRELYYINRNVAHVYFVTGRRGGELVADVTATWIEMNYGIQHPSVIVTEKKGEFARLCKVTHAIDDKLENAWAVHWMADRPQVRSYIITRRYNDLQTDLEIGAKKVIRVKTPMTFFKEVEADYGKPSGYNGNDGKAKGELASEM